MSAVTVRNLAAETHRALKQRAAKHGRSTEAEIRQILDDAVRSETELKIGSELAAFAKQHGGLDFEVTRDQNPAEPASFE